MRRTVSETSRLLGISVRTLHYYDEIGLLKPSEVSEAGYRFYDDDAVATLQQILFLRELDFPVKLIAEILPRPDYDRRDALKKQREWLLLKRERLEEQIRLVDETLGGKPMKNHTQIDLEAAKQRYAAEAAEKWGQTEAYAESQKRHAAYTGAQETAIAEEVDEIFAAFARILDSDPASPEAQALVERWQKHISDRHYPCSKQMLASLGQMYVGDERFTESLDRFGDGTARFMSEAIARYCAE